jgi:hypothetical protein
LPSDHNHHPAQIFLWWVSGIAILGAGAWAVFTYIYPPAPRVATSDRVPVATTIPSVAATTPSTSATQNTLHTPAKVSTIQKKRDATIHNAPEHVRESLQGARARYPGVLTQPVASGTTFFLRKPYDSLEPAIIAAEGTGKLIFAVIYDENHPNLSKLTYSLGYFMEYQTTKQLVDDNFVPVLLKASDEQARKLVPKDDPLENCRWVVLDKRGQILRSEGVYANPDEGLKRVREVISLWGRNE